ncbi:hypothetical protein SLEP1_g58822 [Rubroshorea leprosula]|uniref:Uncharacterized protein n=1 Tax=Rubroshorea leprosula TaxID=152421 RepID=A0AAV5MQM3_9ROSI|nr:hypothetical protein SLEP1_g58822 [Rubroshorea leprosula]
MSSKDTMSVVGSEVMPLEYGGMDSESSPTPTSSERTMEERREQRVVEEDEDEIPSNILEAGSRVDGCYDSELDIVSEVRGYVSELGSRESLRSLMGNCNLPHHVLIRPAGVNERACSAPRDHWMPLYVHYLIVGLRFPIPELLVGLLLDYSIGITQLTPNAIRAGGKGEKGWYYFGPRSSSKENRSLFSAGPSSIKRWKEKFFFVDDTEWSMRDAEDEVEEVGKLVGEEGDVVDILYLTSPKAIEAAELYGPSLLSEGLAIPKRPGKKSKTSNRLEPARGDSEKVSEEVAPLQRKKRKVAEPEVRGDEVIEFMPRPSPSEIDPEIREREEGEVRGPGKGKGLIPPHVMWARDEAVSQLGATVVRHALESASWMNALAQEYAESVRDRASLQRRCEALRKKKEELQKEKEELQKKNKQMQRRLYEVVPTVIELQSDRESLSTRLVFKERKRKIYEDRLDAQDKYIEKMNQGMVELKKNMELLVHNGMEEHIGNFLNSSTFENILKLYRLPTAIVAFTDCRKKVKAQYPEVDVTTITFGEQEEGVEEDEGCTVFPPAFDAKLMAVEEEGEEEEEALVVGVEDQANLAEVQPPEVHPVSSDEVRQQAPSVAEVPPLPTGDEPRSPPLPAEEQPLPLAE